MPNNTVESPCVRNCCLDDNDICMGCFRSLSEIVSWSQADDNTRREIIDKATLRKKDHQARFSQ